MSNETVLCIYRNAVPDNMDLTPEEVLLSCDARGNLVKKRGRTIHADGSRSNEASFRLWCTDPVGWMHSPEGVRYRKKMDGWGLKEYWGTEIGYNATEETIHKAEKVKEKEYRDWYAEMYPELEPTGDNGIGEAKGMGMIVICGIVVLIALALALGRK